MISLRYHVVSLAAVLLALALGVVLGSTGVSHRLLAALSDDRDDLGRQVVDLQTQRNTLAAQLDGADAFGAAVAPLAVRGLLEGRTVVLVTTADAAPADRDAVATLVRQAGGTVTGELALTDAFTDPNRSDALRGLAGRLLPAGAQLPNATDSGTLAGGLVGALVLLRPADGKPQASPQEVAAGLAGLTQGGFVRSGAGVRPAQLAVVLTGGAESGADAVERATVIARFAGLLDRSGAGTVLAGRADSAGGAGPVGVVRADAAASSILSTVDDVQTTAGRVVTVLALREQADGRSGRYGTAGNAQAVAPAAPGT